MKDYIALPLDQDHGGVHKYSGIGNKAFYLAVTQDASPSWEKMGRIWLHAVKLSPPNISFSTFAQKTVEASIALGFGERISAIVADAWARVGVVLGSPPVKISPTMEAPQDEELDSSSGGSPGSPGSSVPRLCEYQ